MAVHNQTKQRNKKIKYNQKNRCIPVQCVIDRIVDRKMGNNGFTKKLQPNNKLFQNFKRKIAVKA